MADNDPAGHPEAGTGASIVKHRIWIYECADCEREVMTRDAALYRYWQRRGYCAACRKPTAEQVARWRLEYLGLSITYRMERIRARGEQVPESKRPPLRVLYAKRRQQLARVKQQIADMPITATTGNSGAYRQSVQPAPRRVSVFNRRDASRS